MKRTGSFPKWKQVLGFDDGLVPPNGSSYLSPASSAMTAAPAASAVLVSPALPPLRAPSAATTATLTTLMSPQTAGPGDEATFSSSPTVSSVSRSVSTSGSDVTKPMMQPPPPQYQQHLQQHSDYTGARPIVPFAELEASTVLPSRPARALAAPSIRSAMSDESPQVVADPFSDKNPAADRVSYSNLPEVVPGTGVEIVRRRSASTRRSFFRRSHDSNKSTKSKVKVLVPSSDLPEPIEFLVKEPTIHRFPRSISLARSGKHDLLLSPSPPAPAPATADSAAGGDTKPLPSLPPQNYISIQDAVINTQVAHLGAVPKDPRSLPDIAIHESPSRESPLLAFASFHSPTYNIAITLLPPPKPLGATSPVDPSAASKTAPEPVYLSTAPAFGNRNQGHRTVKLASSGGIFTAEKYTFSHTLPRTSVLENFEWRHSSSTMVRSLAKSGNTIGTVANGTQKFGPPGNGREQYGGMKLVRCTTSKTVAIFAGDRDGKRTGDLKRPAGVMRFLSDEEGSEGGRAGRAGKESSGLGEEFELLAIMSLLCIMERGKRVMEVHRMTLGDGLV